MLDPITASILLRVESLVSSARCESLLFDSSDLNMVRDFETRESVDSFTNGCCLELLNNFSSLSISSMVVE
jgi:hypothetical protein